MIFHHRYMTTDLLVGYSAELHVYIWIRCSYYNSFSFQKCMRLWKPSLNDGGKHILEITLSTVILKYNLKLVLHLVIEMCEKNKKFWQILCVAPKDEIVTGLSINSPLGMKLPVFSNNRLKVALEAALSLLCKRKNERNLKDIILSYSLITNVAK